jgi:hypothetical protein
MSKPKSGSEASRSFPISAVQALGVSFTAAACAPSVQGNWDLRKVDGGDLTTSYVDDYGCTVEGKMSGNFDLSKSDGDKVTGTYSLGLEYSSDCYDGEFSVDYEGDLTATRGASDDKWKLKGDDFNMSCTVDGDLMDCSDDVMNLQFERE